MLEMKVLKNVVRFEIKIVIRSSNIEINPLKNTNGNLNFLKFLKFQNVLKDYVDFCIPIKNTQKFMLLFCEYNKFL